MQDKPTSMSLLRQAQSEDPEAWRELSQLFGPLVYHWCRCAGLQNQDASDITQNVFTSVYRRICSFQKVDETGSFRGWLWVITRNEIHLHFRNIKRTPQAIGGSSAAQWISDLPAAEPSDFDEPRSPGKASRLQSRCLKMIEKEFQPSAWKVFILTTMEGQTSKAVASEMGMKPNTVRKTKSRIIKRLREKYEGLIAEGYLDQVCRLE